MWVRTDSRNGYFSQFEVYTGKKKGAVEHQLGAHVVKDLTKESYKANDTMSILTFFFYIIQPT